MAETEDAPLSAAQRSRIRRLSAPHEPAPGDEAGELNVVPYLDIIMNILMFVLASVSVSFVGTIDTTPPAIGGSRVRADVSSKALNLSAWITTQGVSLKTSGGNIATGCTDAGSGITVPKAGEEYDIKNLTVCAKRLKNANPAFKEETQVTITANPGIEYKTVIDVMDALRSDGEEDLFPDVHFGGGAMSGIDGPPGPMGDAPKPPVGRDAPGGSGRPPVKQASVVRYKAALRKSIRRNAKEPEIDFLNITAMLDLMTIILVFLLKSLSASSASIPQSKDLSLPNSIITTEAAQEGVVIVISKTQILVGDDPNPVVLLPGPEQLAQSGVDTKYKRSGPNDMYIVPLANTLANARDTDKKIRAAKGLDTSSSEAVIVADATTPYRLLLEVLFTAGQSEFGKYHLMVRSGKKK